MKLNWRLNLLENAFSYAEENLQESSKALETGMETLANFSGSNKPVGRKHISRFLSAKINLPYCKI